MDYNEVLAQARTCMGPYCKACPVCNGLGCRNTVPGPGAKGLGTGFIRNYQKWQELCLNMDTICENGPADSTFDFFGTKLVAPVMAAPVGAMKLHYGDKYDDLTYNDLLVSSCAKSGVLAFTGDGTNAAVMDGALAAISAAGGMGVPTVKPWDRDTVFAKLEQVRKADPVAIAMDIDAAGLPFLQNLTPAGRQQDRPRAARDHRLCEKALYHQGHHDRQGRAQGARGGRMPALSSPTTAAACLTSARPRPRCCLPSPTRWAAR